MTAAYLLDTNIVSEALKARPAQAALDWLGRQPDTALHIAALTLAEIRRGLLEMPVGRRRRDLETWFVGPEGPQGLFADRILPFDDRAALAWARLMADGRVAGRPRSALDMIVAATAAVHGLVVVTANERHFRDCGVPWLNPMTPKLS